MFQLHLVKRFRARYLWSNSLAARFRLALLAAHSALNELSLRLRSTGCSLHSRLHALVSTHPSFTPHTSLCIGANCIRLMEKRRAHAREKSMIAWKENP